MRQTFYVVGGSVGAHRLYRPRMGVSESHDVKKGIVVTGENPIVGHPTSPYAPPGAASRRAGKLGVNLALCSDPQRELACNVSATFV